MRILRVSQEFYPVITGPVKQAYNISKQLQRNGHNSIVLTTTAGTDLEPGVDEFDEIPIHRLRARGHLMGCHFVPSVPKAVLLGDMDVVHVHNWRNLISEYCLHAASSAGIPVVLHAHGAAAMYKHILPRSQHWPYWMYDGLRKRALVRRARVVVASTLQEREELIDFGFHASQIAVIPSGISGISGDCLVDPCHEGGHVTAPGPIRALVVGRLASDRNVEQAIRAVSLLSRSGIRICLRVIGAEKRRTALSGSGYVAALRREVRQLGVEDVVKFAGERSGETLEDEYRNADVFIYTSRYENFGNSVLEAASHGLPIVTTPTGIGPELVKGSGFGAVVPLDDVEATAAALIDAYRQQRRASSSRARLLELITNRFTWNVIGGQYISLYEELIGSRPRQYFPALTASETGNPP